MLSDFLPFAKPSLSDDAIAEVVACLKSGWITTGPRVQKFEEMLTDYHGGRRALALTSATAGLHLVLLALDLQPGDEVITTALTFVATLNTIELAGAKPVLVDIDPATRNIDITKIETAITPRTRAIMPVHYAGLPVDLAALYAIAKKHGIRVVEDAAHAVGAGFDGKRVGSFGDIAVISFHPNKNMTTGEGGAVITEDTKIIERIERLRFHGIDRNAFNRFAKSGTHHYDVVLPGYKYNMMDMQAALGLHQLPALDGFITKRAALVKRYSQAFADWPELTLPKSPSYPHSHAWHLFAPLIEENAAGLDRDGFVVAMKEQNIGIGVHYPAVHNYRYYRETYGYQPESFPHANRVGERICSLPLFPDLTESEQTQVIETMAKVLGRKI